MTNRITDLSGKSQAYLTGRSDWMEEKSESQCPYMRGDDKRRHWFSGWYDCYFQDRHKDVWDKYGTRYSEF